VLSGIVFVNHNGLRWRDAPSAYGPLKTLYNRWRRWGERGVFTRMMEGLAAGDPEPKTVMIYATHLKAHRTPSSLRVKKGISAT
jgi:transposase